MILLLCSFLSYCSLIAAMVQNTGTPRPKINDTAAAAPQLTGGFVLKSHAVSMLVHTKYFVINTSKYCTPIRKKATHGRYCCSSYYCCIVINIILLYLEGLINSAVCA